MKFSANLGFLFTKESNNVVERYHLAKNAGFSGVETPFLSSDEIDRLVEVKNKLNIEQVLINSYPGDLSKGELGLACLPNRKDEFVKTLENTITYAKRLNCPKIHILSGKTSSNICEEDMLNTYIQNIKFAAEQLEEENIICLIEPINNRSVPGYFMNSIEKLQLVLEKVNHSNLKILLDFYHAQIIHGDLSKLYNDLLPYIGHIQVAQVPDRGDPASEGEINYNYLLDLINRSGYKGWIGLEYMPKHDTLTSLNWLKSANLFS